MNRRSGFTLIEVVVSSAILMMTSGALIYLGRTAIRSNDLILERSQAYQLAQAGIEIVRQIRDTAYLDRARDQDWANFWPTDTAKYSPCWNPINNQWELIKQNCASVTVSEGVESIDLNGLVFRRSILVLEPNQASFLPLSDQAGNQLDRSVYSGSARRVHVSVEWESMGRNWQIDGETLLTDWKPKY